MSAASPAAGFSQGETIRAVIWCSAVEANGGEVLKFIGDAMLAIFPPRSTRSPPVATR
jgi:class 3 adenylate cyclase